MASGECFTPIRNNGGLAGRGRRDKKPLQSLVDVSGTAAFRRVAGDVLKFAFSEAGGTLFRDGLRFQDVAALLAFPKGLSAGRTHIIFKRGVGLIPAYCTFMNSH
jgi:hypothetical protein